MHITRKWAWLFLTLISLVSCRKEFERPAVSNEILTPILTTQLTINEIIPDSLRETDASNFVSLVYRNLIYSSSFEELEEIEARVFRQTANLQTLTLPSRSFSRPITLGEVARVIGGTTGNDILNAHGSVLAIPPFPFQYDSIEVDASELFETVTLDSGYLEVRVENNLPTAVSNAVVQIRNQSNGEILGTSTFPSIPKGAIVFDTIDLAGKTMEAMLFGHIVNLFAVGTSNNEVPIDTNDAVEVQFTTRDLKVNAATAVFPSQPVIDIADTLGVKNIGDIRLTSATAKTGQIDIRVVSTIAEPLVFEYEIPGSIKDGDTFQIQESIPGAPNGGSSEATFSYPVDGYSFDFTGAPDSNLYNALYSSLKGSIVSSGNVVSISLDDSISLFVELSGFIPEYLEGYLGNSSTTIGPEDIPITLFNSISDGTISFEDVSMGIGVRNGNGVPFNVGIEALSVSNSKTGATFTFDVSSIPSPLEVEGAPNFQTPWESTWDFDAGGQVNEALNLLPDRIQSTIGFESNPNQNVADLTQFAIDSNMLEAFLDLEIPLSLIANGLTLSDTAIFTTSAIDEPEQVIDGELYLNVLNSFPLSAGFYLEFLDDQGNLMQRVDFEGQVASGVRENPSKTVLTWPFERSDFEMILASSQVVMYAFVSTESAEQYAKLYSDQGFGLTISTRLNYQFENP